MADDLTARLRDAADKSANGGGEWFQLVHRCREAADRIDALSGDVARLTAERGADRRGIGKLIVRCVDTERERDEALALVAERDATIERLRDALAAIRSMPTTAGVADPATQMQHIATAVLADTAPTPVTGPQDPTEEP